MLLSQIIGVRLSNHHRHNMPSSNSSAISPITTNLLPAGQIEWLGSNYLICILLWSISWATFGAKSGFSLLSGKMAGRRSLEPRAVAVDMVWGARKARAVAADDRHQRLVEAPAVDIGGGEPLPRGNDALAQPAEIDRHEAPVVDDQPAADHHARHRRAVLGMDELVDRIVERQPVRVVEVEHDDVGLITGSDPPDFAGKAQCSGAALGRR